MDTQDIKIAFRLVYMKWWQNPNGNAATILNKHICEENNKLWEVNHTYFILNMLFRQYRDPHRIYFLSLHYQKNKGTPKKSITLSVSFLNSHRIKLICILILLALMKLVQEFILCNLLVLFSFDCTLFGK